MTFPPFAAGFGIFCYNSGMREHKLNPTSQAVVDKIRANFDDTDPEVAKTEYGHLMLNVAGGISAGGDVYDKEGQLIHLRKVVLGLLERFGPKIVPLLREELRDVITEEEMEKYSK